MPREVSDAQDRGPERAQPTLFAASTFATIAAVIGSVPGFFIPIAIARFLGADSRTDAFFMALSVATLIASAVGSTTQQAAIPFLMEAKRLRRDIGVYIGEISAALLLLAIVPTLLLSWGVVLYVRHKGIWTSDQIRMLSGFLWVFVPYIAFSVLSGVYAGALNAKHNYMRVAVSPAVRSGFVLVAVFLSGASGVGVLAVGYVVGELARLVFLWTVVAREHQLRPLAWPRTAGVEGFSRTAVAQMLGSGVVAFLPLLDRLMASRLGAGSVSVLDYADRLWQIPVGFAVSGFMVTSLGHWSERLQRGGTISMLGRDTSRLAAYSFAAAIPLCAIFVLFRGSIMSTVFASTRISSADVLMLTDTLAAMVCGIPAYIAGLIYTRAFLVLKRSDMLFAVALFQLVAKATLNVILLPLLGTVGIGAATAITYTAAACLLVLLFHAGIARSEGLGGDRAEGLLGQL